MPEKPRVVLDTNVLLSAILFGKSTGEIIKMWHEGIFDLLFSPETLAELIGKLKYKFGLPQDLVEEWQDIFTKKGVHVLPEYKTEVCRDPEDNKFIDVALKGKAAYLVTGDKDLLVLKKYKELKILNPKEFLKLVKKTLN